MGDSHKFLFDEDSVHSNFEHASTWELAALAIKTCTWGIYGDYNILRGLSNIMTDHSNFVQIQKYHLHNEHMGLLKIFKFWKIPIDKSNQHVRF